MENSKPSVAEIQQQLQKVRNFNCNGDYTTILVQEIIINSLEKMLADELPSAA
jgi:hypothetical protein